MRFLTGGYTTDLDAVINNALFTVEYNEMVIVRDIDFYSLCEHHLLPFFGKCHVAYIPDGKVIGLSKIPRIVDVFARRLAGAGAAHVTDRRDHPRPRPPARRRRRDGSDAPLHGHARHREAEFGDDDERDARACFHADARTRHEFLQLIRLRDAPLTGRPVDVHRRGCMPE